MTAQIENTASSVRASPSREREQLDFSKVLPDKKGLLQSLLTSYNEKTKRIKPEQRRVNKQIHSLVQGHDGTKAECFKCGVLVDIEFAEIHHINENPYDNRLINTAPIHGKCNRELNGVKGGMVNAERAAVLKQRYHVVTPKAVSESAGGADTYEQEWTSKEGEKHDQMRFKWNVWILDLENGPFAKGQTYLFKELAYMAVRALGLGSSVTYRRYIMEDHYGRVLDVYPDPDNGLKKVRLIARPNTEKVQ